MINHDNTNIYGKSILYSKCIWDMIDNVYWNKTQ